MHNKHETFVICGKHETLPKPKVGRKRKKKLRTFLKVQIMMKKEIEKEKQ